MPSVDEQLTRALREAAPRPTTSGLDQRLARRRRARAARRRVGTAALTVVVLAGTAAGFVALSDAFEGDEQVREPSPTPAEPTPTVSSSDAIRLAGVPFAVCRITTVPGDFGPGLDTAWVFEEEHTPGSGCDRSEGFQHLAVGSDGRVRIMSRRLTDVLDDDAWRVWAYAAPDLNDDGTDEIAVARQGREPDARHLWLFRVADGGVVPITEECGPACDPVPWNIEIGPIRHEDGAVTNSGLLCGGPEDRDVLTTWQADPQDPLHVYLSKWRFDRTMLVPAGDIEAVIFGKTGQVPASGLDELCGSPTNRSVDFPFYLTEDVEPTELCNTSSMTGDVNGDGATDLVTIGSVVGPDGCPSEGQRNRILTIDLDGDQRADVVSDAIDCSTWCFPFVAADLSGDGTAEILVNEGHTAPPASAAIAVYALVDDDLVPVTFPDGTNRFPLVNSSQGYHGAYCLPEDGVFVTWHGETDDGGSLERVTYDFFELDEQMLRFESLPQGGPWYSDLPPVGQRGYEGVFCGVEVEPLG